MRRRASAAVWTAVLLAVAALAGPASAAAGELSEFADTAAATALVPDLESLDAPAGDPPTARFTRKDGSGGALFLTSDWVASSGYSGKPIKILVGLGDDGVITGARVAEHHEPILVLGIPEGKLSGFLDQYAGLDISRRIRLERVPSPRDQSIDLIGGATITSVVFNDSIVRAARLVARREGISLGTPAPSGSIDVETFSPTGWAGLLDQKSVAQIDVSNAEAADVTGVAVPDGRRPKDRFVNLFAALATPAGIGQNLLGFAQFTRLKRDLPEGAHVLFVAARGLYSFRGYNYRKTGVFDRLQLVQGDRTIPLTREMHRSLEAVAAEGAPELREISLFVLPRETGFDATRPWRLDVVLDTAGAIVSLPYRLPDRFVAQAADEVPPWMRFWLREAGVPDNETPLWVGRWLDHSFDLAVLVAAMILLTAILFLQDWLVKHTRLLSCLRVGFLLFTLVFIGWVTAAQLSVINVLTFVNALLSGFKWDFFLLEPLIFTLWSGVAIGLLFWGRGVFCGWLCPFGALQELTNRLGRMFRVPQVSVPFYIHERLWPWKYMIFLGIFALSLGSASLASVAAEVEPFKTAIALKFLRAAPFAAYALAVLIAGMFIQRVFCRYVCPLGAALAIPANNRMFDWLKRRYACGRECHICASRCPVEAIHPNGRINPHECIYCLDCQVIYHDDHRCPPLIERRKRREDRQRRKEERKAARAAAAAARGETP